MESTEVRTVQIEKDMTIGVSPVKLNPYKYKVGDHFSCSTSGFGFHPFDKNSIYNWGDFIITTIESKRARWWQFWKSNKPTNIEMKCLNPIWNCSTVFHKVEEIVNESL